MKWLFFLSQLPSQPSSLRVYVWRKLRTAGALGLQNGVWLLPDTQEQRAFLETLLASVKEQGATGQIFTVMPFNELIEKDVLGRFRADRDEEYIEFIEQGHAFLAEIEKETAKEKFTFAELEENEQELQRLSGWLDTIRNRDFFAATQQKTALTLHAECDAAFQTFAEKVYDHQSGEVN